MLRRLDIFPKLRDGESVKTSVGGLITILSCLCLIYNVYTELVIYRPKNKVTELSSNKIQLPNRLPFEIDMYVWNDCENLHIDFMNIKRTAYLEAKYTEKDFKQIENFCYIVAKGTIPTAPGSVHIGLGKNAEYKQGEHSHQYLTVKNTNLSHRIRLFTFGNFSIDSPLYRYAVNIPKPEVYMVKYDLNMIPMIINKTVGFQILADVSKTKMEKVVNKGISGIVFDWQFSPLQLSEINQKNPFIFTLSRILGIFGSFFMLIRWLDRLVFKILLKLRRRK